MNGEAAGRAEPGDEGGEPACMLALLCPSCGRVPHDPDEPRCSGCGAEQVADEVRPPAAPARREEGDPGPTPAP